jgi:predicted transcriptional regulator of viral defense system
MNHHPSKFLKKLYDGATVLRSRELEQRGLNRAQIRQAANEGALERVAYGLYALPGVAPSEHHSLVQVSRRVPHAAICLLSALRFHDLTTQNPHEVWIAIGSKDRKPAPGSPPVRVVRFGPQHFDLGLAEHRVEGTHIRVYSVARTVVDLFRYRNKIGLEVALEALREGWRSRRFSLAEINRIAGLCRMTRVMKPYLESLVS